MTGAVALAIVLVIAVAGLSLAMQSQRTAQSPQTPRPPRAAPSAHATAPAPATGRPRLAAAGRDAAAAGSRRTRGPGARAPAFGRAGGSQSHLGGRRADHRTGHPEPPDARDRPATRVRPFEVTTRVAFPTPAARARVKVGGNHSRPLRPGRPTRIVVDLPTRLIRPPPRNPTVSARSLTPSLAYAARPGCRRSAAPPPSDSSSAGCRRRPSRSGATAASTPSISSATDLSPAAGLARRPEPGAGGHRSWSARSGPVSA